MIGLSGSLASANIGSGADIETTVGSAASLGGSGNVVVEAKTRNGGNKAIATAKGGTGGVLFAGTLFIGVATIASSVQAHLNGTVTGASSLAVTADGHYTAAADVVAGSVSLGGALAGSVAYANITSGADVVADAASTADVGIAGATTITANGTHTATANSEVISFGFISLGVSVPTAITGGGTAAAFDGSVTGGGGLTVQVTAVDNASVDSTPIAIGAFAGNGAAAYAEVTKDTQVTAGVGAGAVLAVGSSTVKVQTTVTSSASATLDSGAFGGLAVSIMFATSYDRGGSSATFGGGLRRPAPCRSRPT